MQITLSANELLDLLFEKSIQKEEFTIACSSSFLAIMSLFESKMTEESEYERT